MNTVNINPSTFVQTARASAITVIIGGIVGYYRSTLVRETSVLLLPFVAGNFIYIAASGLIPEIKHGDNIGRNLLYFFTFIIGVLLMLGLKFCGRRHAIIRRNSRNGIVLKYKQRALRLHLKVSTNKISIN